MTLEEHLKSCTVSVRCGNSQGTGFFIAQDRVVTSRHVLENGAGSKVEVLWKGETFPAERIALRAPGGPSGDVPDLALLAVECPRNPVVLLAADYRVGDPLYCYGFTREYPNGEPATALLEGISEGPTLLKLKSGQIRPGLSGAPILNLRTGAVCGVLKSTRGRGTDLGGRGIPAATLLAALPEESRSPRLRRDRRWTRLLTWRQRWRLAPLALRLLPVAGLALAFGLAAVSWIARPALWHRILGTPVLVLPFSPPPSLVDERVISGEIHQALVSQVREEAGLKPVFAEIARPIASTLDIHGPCLPPDPLGQIHRTTSADFVLSGGFEVSNDQKPWRLTACFQSTRKGSKAATHSYTLVKGEEEIEAAAADVARWVRELSGPPALSRWWTRDTPDERAVRDYFEGVEHLQRYELQAAQNSLLSAVKRDGNFYPARRELSRLWQILGNDGAALDEARRALELLRRSGATVDAREDLLPRAHLLATQGQWDRAVPLLQEAWQREPEAGEIAVRLAEAQNQAGMAEQALLSIQEARKRQGLGRLALTPELDAGLDLEEATAWFWLGQAKQQLDAARRALDKLLRLPEDRGQLVSRARYFECIAFTRLDETKWPETCDLAIRRFKAKKDLINEAKFRALFAGWLRKRGKENQHRAELLDRWVLGVYRDKKFTRGIIDQATNLAYTLSDLGEDLEARTLCKEALGRAREQRSLNLPSVLTTCAYFDAVGGSIPSARDKYAEALPLARQRGDEVLTAVILGNLAYMDHASGDLAQAGPRYEESLRLSRELGDLGWDYGETLVRFARLLLDRRQESAARERLREAWNCYLIEEPPSELSKCLESIDTVVGRNESWTRLASAELAGPRDSRACPPPEDLEPEPGTGTDG